MNRNKKTDLIRNPADFRNQYLSENAQVLCSMENTRTHNFFEIFSLDKLRSMHKNKSFGTSRRNFYTLVLITKGKIKETIGHKNYEFGANTLYVIPENQLHSIEHWSADIKGYHCIFDADYFLLCLRQQVKLSRYPFFQPDKDLHMKLSETESQSISDLFGKMKFEYCQRKSINDDLLVRLYLNVLLIEIERIFLRKQKAEDDSTPKRQQMVATFRKLVSQHYLEKRQVSDYASLLYVTPHYLNDTIKEATGKPASEYIQEEMIREAKAQLIQTDHTVTQIATELNFSDQSYFCRFFKKHTGFSPKEFRRKHLH